MPDFLTVQELINKLKEKPRDALVFVAVGEHSQYAPAIVTSWSKETPDVVIIARSSKKASISGQQLEEGWRPKV